MRLRLFVVEGRDLGRSFELEEEGLAGRSAQCAVRLRDRSVSRVHARFREEAEGWVVEDLGSRNGIRRGSRRVRRALLEDGDELYLGELGLRVRLGERPVGGGPPGSLEPPPAAPEPPPLEVEEEIHLEPVHEPGAVDPDGVLRRPSAARRRSGIWTSDLGQWPLWVRVLAAFVALLVFLGLSALSFRAVQDLRH